MGSSLFQLVKSYGGWQLLDNGKAVFWFATRDKALEIATLMADARNLYRGLPAIVEAQNGLGEFEVAATFG